jgi:hypothetical protein
VELAHGVSHTAPSEEACRLDAGDPRRQAPKGFARGRIEVGSEPRRSHGSLHREREQRRVINGELAEQGDALKRLLQKPR